VTVVVTGSSGLLGSAIVANLRADGHRVVRLVRRPPRAEDERAWDPAGGTIDAEALTGADAVIHLAGAGVGDRRWNDDYRSTILRSRVDGTRTVAQAIADRPEPRPALLSMSGVGYYGDTGDDTTDESGPSGEGFLADVVRQWEAAARPASDAGARVVCLRTGVVLTAEGGALRRVLPLFKAGIGGRLGSGRQWMSWIALPDYLAAVRFLLARGDIDGPVNVTAPEPTRNRDYTKAIARAVHRPAVAVVPPFALRAVLGGFADEGVLISQRVVPGRLEAAGFAFTYDEVFAAVSALVG
jgi:uncharacterized protein (TIGR01777 family)